MQFTFIQRVICGLTIPDGISLTIGDFVFLPDFEGEHVARHIKTVIEAQTEEEAKIKANKILSDFFARLSLIDNSKYSLGEDVSISPFGSGITTRTVSISGKAYLVQDGNRIKNAYELMKEKHLRVTPIRLYRDGLNTDNPFDKFRNFYRVLETYDKTSAITTWILRQIPDVVMKNNNHGNSITIFTWIRIKLSHSKNQHGDLTPFLISNPQHVKTVITYLPKMQELARTRIREKEGL